MFIQVMNRVLNEAIFHPVTGDLPVRVPTGDELVARPAPTPKVRTVTDSRATPATDMAVPATFQIYASAFNTAVHGS